MLMHRGIYGAYLGNYAFTDWRQRIEDNQQRRAVPVAPCNQAKPDAAEEGVSMPQIMGGCPGPVEGNEKANE
jgi:hypothetical protein